MSNICGNCKHFYCDGDGRCHAQDETWTYSDDDACEKFENQDKYAGTHFRKITTSPEVLAPYFVRADFDEPFLPWFSTLTNESFETYEEAFAATVEKLKEICHEK